MRYHNITKDDMLNGEGLRVVLWVAGCSHGCKNCQNPITWDPNGGLPFDEAAKAEIFAELEKDYISGITFSGGGALYKYNPKTGEATDISPTSNHAYGAVYGDPKDANKLIATSCDFGYSQMWDANAWKNDTVAWGSQFYRSTDGGATWESITPGNETTWGGPLQADYLQDGGRPWIRGYAVHWSGAMVLDPRDSD